MDCLYNDYTLDEGILDTYNLDTNYSDMLHMLEEHIEADCFGVKTKYGDTNEVIFNTNQELSLKEHIMEEMIRDTLITSLHRFLLCNLLRKQMDFTLEIYMFRSTPWKLVIKYDRNTNNFYIYKMVSQQYIDRFD